MLYLNFPNEEEVLGYFMLLSNTKMHFKPLETVGEKVFREGEKKSWMEPFPKLTTHKLLVLPFY